LLMWKILFVIKSLKDKTIMQNERIAVSEILDFITLAVQLQWVFN